MSIQIKRVEQKFYNMCATLEKDASKVSTLFTSIQNAIKRVTVFLEKIWFPDENFHMKTQTNQISMM